ncbi:MAG: hypothetical protein A2148_02730 [Chloroflexi bacterium RBG_16_68_14]|nr:MAG: hypothetical protein A2148_02730 [Chloroflexi bacterium RBG_16_68_14]
MLIVLGAVLLVGGIAAACTSDNGGLEDRVTKLEQERTSLAEEVAAIHEQTMYANMVATLNLLDDVGFHELYTTILETREAPAGTSGPVRTALRAVAVTEWPDELDAAAQDFQQKLQTFFDVLRGEDQSSLRDAAQAAHDMYHGFTGDCWQFLAASIGLEDIGERGDHLGETN